MQGGTTVGIVLKSKSDKFQAGDDVVVYLGWRRYEKCHANDIKKISKVGDVPLSVIWAC